MLLFLHIVFSLNLYVFQSHFTGVMEWKVHRKNLCVKLHSITLTDFENKKKSENLKKQQQQANNTETKKD